MSDPILEAAIDAWNFGPGRGVSGCCTDVIAAVRPLIEAEVRESITRDIEWAYLFRDHITADEAARIVRGGDHVG